MRVDLQRELELAQVECLRLPEQNAQLDSQIIEDRDRDERSPYVRPFR
jgi:hypothetical protein